MTREKSPVGTLPKDNMGGFHVKDAKALGGQILDHLDHQGSGLISRQHPRTNQASGIGPPYPLKKIDVLAVG